MRIHKTRRADLTRPALTPDEDDRMRELFVGAFADCRRRPEVVYQTAHGARAPWRRLMAYLIDGIARGACARRIARFFDGARLIVLARAYRQRLTIAELLRLEAETDADADRAEIAFALERSDANRVRLVEATLAHARVKEDLALALSQPHEPVRLALVRGGRCA